MLWEISQNPQENICARISILVFSCESCGICKHIFFAERLFIIEVSIVAKGVLANETINYDTQTKAYILFWATCVSY